MAASTVDKKSAKPSAQNEARHDLRILNAIRQIIRAADIDSRKLAAQHQITAPQLMSLMAVVEKGSPVTAIDVARRVHLSPSTLVGILDRLEAKNLIRRERSTDDRREVFIVPTEAGLALVAKTPFPLQYSLGKALDQLTQKEREEIARWMERLVDLMGANEVFPGPMLELAALGEGHGPSPRHTTKLAKSPDELARTDKE
jgi:DNA-binding MarR family transcriptional regulator